MTDIVERLRKSSGEPDCEFCGQLELEAAGEIERLRAAVDKWHMQVMEGITEIEQLRSALDRLVNDSMYKDHPEASQAAIDALRGAGLDVTQKAPNSQKG
jgi:hypothetical protein